MAFYEKVVLIALLAIGLIGFGCTGSSDIEASPTILASVAPTIVPAPIASVSVTSEPSVAIANPASVHCVEVGGRVDLRDSQAGQVGVCVFPNGTECEEWKLFRNESCAEATPTPASITVDVVEAAPASAPYCLVTAIPWQATKFIYTEVVANFYNFTETPRLAVFSCQYSNETLTSPVSNTTAKGYCSFHLQNNTRTLATVTASAGGVSCNTTVTVEAPQFMACSLNYSCMRHVDAIRQMCAPYADMSACGYYEGEEMKCYSCESG